MIKILFICHGNICRSPICEFIMKELVKEKGIEDEFEIESAATTTEEIYRGVGNPVYPPARAKLLEHGISCEGKRARLMTRADYDRFDLLIGMDEENIYDMNRICGEDPEKKIHMLLDYTDKPGSVADPWYTRNFEATWQDALRGCKALLKHIMMSGS